MPDDADRPDRGQAGEQVTACVVNYEGERTLSDTLAAIFRQGEPVREVLLVDGGSRDASLELVRSRFPPVRVLALGANLGPAAARNAGFRTAAFDRILFVDNDVVLEDGCVKRLWAALDGRPRAVAAMPRVMYASDPDTIQYHGAESHFVGLMALAGAGEPAAAAPTRTRAMSSVITACCLMDRRRWEAAQTPAGTGAASSDARDASRVSSCDTCSRSGAEEPFDDSFFIYLEDHDFGLRARLAGLEILAVPAAVCRHGGGTEGLSLRATGLYAPLRVRNLIRNRWLVLLRDYQARTLLVLFPALAAYEAFQLAGVVRKGWLREWMEAAAWIGRNRGEILHDRRAVQRSRTTGDWDILTGGQIPFAPELTTGPLERVGIAALNAITETWWRMARGFL